MKKKKQPSGWDKTRYAGKKTVLLTMTPEQLEFIRQAAALEMRPVTQFFMFHTMEAARKHGQLVELTVVDLNNEAKQNGRG